MNTLKLFSLFTALLISFVAFTGCSDDDGDDNTTDPTPTETANLMVVHASPDAPGVDVTIDDDVEATNLEFPNNTDYFEVVTGTRTIHVDATGTTNHLVDYDQEFVVDKNYSLFTIDKLYNIDAVFTEDDLTAPAAGKAHVRFVHLVPDGPEINIAIQFSGGGPLFSNIAFKTITEFVDRDAGTITLKIKNPNGTQGSNDITTGDITLAEGKIYTIAVVGLVEDNSIALKVIENN